jgi:hypothetical protein
VTTWCVTCHRKLLRPAAIKARRAAGNVLVAVGPVGPKCARGELLMPPPIDPKTGFPKERRVRLFTVHRKRKPTPQLDWVSLLQEGAI